MMKTIYTITTPSSDISSLERISEYAISIKAHLVIDVISVTIAMPSSVYPGVDTVAGEFAFDVADRKARAHSLLIKEKIGEKDLSVSTATICQPRALIAAEVGKRSLYSDIAIIPGQVNFPEGLYHRSIEGVLFDAGIPVMVLPDTMNSAINFDKVLVGWYPNSHSARAVRGLTGFLTDQSDVHIAVVDPTDVIFGPNPGNDIATVLARKQFQVSVERVSSISDSVGVSLSRAAVDFDADVLAVGAYGHSKLREVLFGGTTRHLLEAPPCPVLLCH